MRSNELIPGQYYSFVNDNVMPIFYLCVIQISELSWSFLGHLIPTDCSTANQSTTLHLGVSDANRACDGNTSTDYMTPPHCTHTALSNDSWWQVELGPGELTTASTSAPPVAAVDIYFRSDDCSTFIFVILNV